MRVSSTPDPKQAQFDLVYRHEPAVVAYCQRRGSRDPEGLAAEAMMIAWRRIDDLDLRDCRPWLFATARNLLFEEYRARGKSRPMDPAALALADPRSEPAFEIDSLSPRIDRSLAALAPGDREVLLLVAWEDLAPAQAARSLGIRPSAFRVRLHRARRRFKKAFNSPIQQPTLSGGLPVEEKS